MKIISRSEWNAAPPDKKHRGIRVPMSMRTEFIVHHSAGPANQTVREIQRYQMQERGFRDIGYNFLIRSTTGDIYEGRGWKTLGAHTVGRNLEGIGVCLIGTDHLSEGSKDALREMYALAVHLAGHPLQVRGHRDHAPTECPGTATMKWLRSGGLESAALPLLVLTTPRMVGPAVRIVQEITGAAVDGIYGPKTARSVREWQASHDLVADGIVGPLTWAKMGITRLH